MDLNLSGWTVLVTGASKGIGAAVARSLAAEGCALELTARNGEALAALAEDLWQSCGVAVGAHMFDLATAEGQQQLIAAVPTPDILVNNAGAIPSSSPEELEENHWRAG